MLDEMIKTKLLTSILNDSLIVFCGAGISMAAPSNLPSAASLAQSCATQYKEIFGHDLPAEIDKNDLEAVAKYFYDRNELINVFIQRVVPWKIIRKESTNKGHQALADFLSCGALEAVVSTNFDSLIEIAARELGEPDFEACINGNEMNLFREHRPLLKLHGCVNRNRRKTVWCKEQAETDEEIKEQVKSSDEWLRAHLKERDLVLVGFWSDWSYLNEILERCVSSAEPRMVILVDPSTQADLQAKAPELWRWAHRNGVEFHHINASGDEFLKELRHAFCQNFLDMLIFESTGTFKSLTGREPPDDVTLSTLLNDLALYEVRRDACGVPIGQVTRYKKPEESMKAVGASLLLLQEAQAIHDGQCFVLNKSKFRVVNGSGRTISEVKAKFKDEQPTRTADVIICAGAIDDGGIPISVARGETEPTIVRSGVFGEWIDLKQAIAKIGG